MGPGRKPMRMHHSAGGVVVGRRGTEALVALIQTHGKTRFGLPKGTIDDGETSEQAAVREVREETGLEASILCHLDEIDYVFRAHQILVHKFVDYYLMKYVEGELVPQLEEVDDVSWLPLQAAAGVLSFDSERRVVERARMIWSEMSEGERSGFSCVG